MRMAFSGMWLIGMGSMGCFCRETFRGYGNHPWPVLETGTSNRTIVCTARLLGPCVVD